MSVNIMAVCTIGYSKGCRCVDCKKAVSAQVQQNLAGARQRFQADPTTLKKHGSYGYQLGCRCDVCKRSKSLYMSARNRKQVAAVKQFQANNSIAANDNCTIGYTKGCRCAVCKQANSVNGKLRKARALQRFIDTPEHLKVHGSNSYKIGCRCDVCKRASSLETLNRKLNQFEAVNEYKATHPHLAGELCKIGYRSGCRCTTCKKEAALEAKQYRANRIELFKADPTSIKKHGLYAYNIGCRCEVCLQAYSEYYLKTQSSNQFSGGLNHVS